MSKKFCSLVGVVFIVLSGVCAFGQDRDPNAAEVIQCYKESLSHLQSVSMKIEIEVDVDANHPNKLFCPYERHFTFRRDNGRAEWLGQMLIFDDQGNVDPNNSRVIKRIMTGELYADVISSLRGPLRGVLVTRDYKENQKELLDNSGHGGVLFGRIFDSSHKSVAELLGGAGSLHLRSEREDINGVSCYVLEAATKYGKVTAWVAPKKGYNALKWAIHKTRQEFLNETSMSDIEMENWTAIFDSVEIQKVNDVFVTTGGSLTHTVNFADGRTYVSYHKYKVSDIQLNPDFEALGAFKVNLSDGTRVFMKEYPGIRYIWQNGKIMPDVDAPTFEEIDKMMLELKK